MSGGKDWPELFTETLSQMLDEPFPASEGLRVLFDYAIWDTVRLDLFLQDGRLEAQLLNWPKIKDAERWSKLAPDARKAFEKIFQRRSAALTGAEADYFPGFLQELEKAVHGEVIEPVAGYPLDGAECWVRVLRAGKISRLYQWDSHYQTRGVMAQAERLFDRVNRQVNPL